MDWELPSQDQQKRDPKVTLTLSPQQNNPGETASPSHHSASLGHPLHFFPRKKWEAVASPSTVKFRGANEEPDCLEIRLLGSFREEL